MSGSQQGPSDPSYMQRAMADLNVHHVTETLHIMLQNANLLLPIPPSHAYTAHIAKPQQVVGSQEGFQ